MIELISHLPISETLADAVLVPTSMYAMRTDYEGRLTALEEAVLALPDMRKDDHFTKRVFTTGRVGGVVSMFNPNINDGWLPKAIFATPTRYLTDTKPDIGTLIKCLHAGHEAARRWSSHTLAIDLTSFTPYDNYEVLEYLIEEEFESDKSLDVEVYLGPDNNDNDNPTTAVAVPDATPSTFIAKARGFIGV